MTQQQVVPQFRTPEDLAVGAYANGVGVWSTPNDFTIDFFIGLPPEAGEHPQTGEPIVVAPQQIVARVKLPPTLVFQLMRNLNTAMTTHEQEHGPIPEFQSGARPDWNDPEQGQDNPGAPSS